MIVGFTGTRRGMNEKQLSQFIQFLKDKTPATGQGVLHHGDCIGADFQANNVAIGLRWQIVIHPPTDPKFRAWCSDGYILEKKQYLIRNHHIVDACSVLVAAPGDNEETVRSGTWATVRYARKHGVRVVVLDPN